MCVCACVHMCMYVCVCVHVCICVCMQGYWDLFRVLPHVLFIVAAQEAVNDRTAKATVHLGDPDILLD